MVERVSASMNRGCLSAQDRDVSYRDNIHWNAYSLARYRRPWARGCSGFRKTAHIMGVVVSEMTSERMIATDRVTANSRNSRPTIPPINRMGRKTAISERLMETTVNVISLAPRRAASRGGIPCSLYRLMFSSTTMASSTTNPVAMVSAMRERLSRLYESRYMAPKVPTSESGTATVGTSVARMLRRKANTTSTTRQTLITSVNCTSPTEARIVWLRSCATWTSMAGEMEPDSCGSNALTRS